MKTTIYYFSATGNSLVVAQDIAKELNADVVPITKALKDSSGDQSDVVGIVFPVYMFGIPLIVAKFLNALKVKENAYVFSVATFGGMPGRATHMVRKILTSRGIELKCGFGVTMPGNYTPLYGAIPIEQQNTMFEIEKNRAKEIAGLVRQQKSGIFEEKPIAFNTLLWALLYKAGSSQIPNSDKGFWVNDACTSCGLCEKVCPVNNIKMNNKRPQWLHHCEHCMACLQWCPVSAIQYKKSTAGKKRYHHPGVSSADIMKGKDL